jgi:exonuclease SbcC
MTNNSRDRKIKSLQLINFLNHEDTHIDFSDGLNIITGSSNSGKSAITRALHAVFWNETDNEYVRRGAKFYKIIVTFFNGDKITRIKGPDNNRIEFQYFGQPVQISEKFKTKFDQEVVDFLGYQPVTSSGPLSLSLQKSDAFLVNLTKQEIPREISKILDINDLEKAATVINSDINKFSTDIKSKQSELNNLEEDLKNYENLPEKKLYLEEFHSSINDYNSFLRDIDEKKKLISNSNLKNKLFTQKTQEKENHEKFIKSVSKIVNKISDIFDGYKIKNKMFEDFNDKALKLNKTRKLLKIHKSFLSEDFVLSLQKIEKLFDSFQEAKSYLSKITKVYTKIESTQEKIEKENDKIIAINIELDECSNIISEYPVCPTCGKR